MRRRERGSAVTSDFKFEISEISDDAEETVTAREQRSFFRG
jgi:hypothetical protein